MSRLAFTAGWSTSSRNRAMLATSFSSESANGSSSSAISRPRPAAYSPSAATFSTPTRHCSAGGITSFCQMYSPSTSRTFLRLEEVRHVEVRPDPLGVEPPDAGVEVDQPHGDAGHAHDRQAGGVAFVLDQPLLLDVDVERIGEDVDRVEADLPGLVDAERGPAAGLDPGRIDQAELHEFPLRVIPRPCDGAGAGWAVGGPVRAGAGPGP